LSANKCEQIYLGSVVKTLTKRIESDIHALTKTNVRVIKSIDFKKEFNLKKFNVNEIGTDILALALAVKKNYKSGVGISFGTATFAVCVDDSHLLGAIIAPSIELGIQQLTKTTSLITKKSIDLTSGNLAFATNTKGSLQSGSSHMAKGFVVSIMDYVNKQYHIRKTLITGGKTSYLQFLDKLPDVKILNDATLIGYYQLSKTI
jgi:pantothenate kinase type III